jgi:predicted xylose isomerase-like sugar epimerase
VIRSLVHLTAIVNSTENLHIEIDKKVLLLKYDDSESKKSRCRRLFRLAECGHRSSEPFSSAALLPAIEDVVDPSIQ